MHHHQIVDTPAKLFWTQKKKYKNKNKNKKKGLKVQHKSVVFNSVVPNKLLCNTSLSYQDCSSVQQYFRATSIVICPSANTSKHNKSDRFLSSLLCKRATNIISKAKNSSYKIKA